MRIIKSFFLQIVFFSCVIFSQSHKITFDTKDTLNDETLPLPAKILKIVGDAYDLNNLGIQLLDANDLSEAMNSFEKALDIYPDYSDAKNNRGVVYYRMGKIGTAEKIWQSLSKSDKKYAISRYNLAVVAYHEKNYKKSISYLSDAIKINKRFAEAYVMHGKIRLLQSDLDNALKSFKKAFSINPDNESVWGMYAYGLLLAKDTLSSLQILNEHTDNAKSLELIGKIEITRGNIDKAQKFLKKALKLGGNPDIMLNLAQLFSDSGMCQKAISSVKSYIKSTPQGSPSAWLILGSSARDCGDINLTLSSFEKGLKYFPQDPLLRINLGNVYFYLKKYKLAKSVWSVLSDSLEVPSIYYQLAIIADKESNIKDAEKYINRAIELERKPEYLDFLGIISYKSGNKEKAVHNFKQALRIDPDYKSSKLNLALVSASQNDLTEAINSTKSELDSCKEDCSEISLKLSILYYKNGELDKAISVVESVNANEGNESVYRHLAFLYRQKHNYKKAISILEKARNEIVLEEDTEIELINDYMNAGFYNKAINVINDLLEKGCKKPWRLRYQLGYAFMELGKTDLAIEQFKKSLKMNDKNVAARGVLAFLYNRTGNIAKARELWEKNLKEDPSNPTIWINMGLLLESESNLKDALNNYLKAYNLNKDNKAIQLNIGNIYSALNMNDKAMEAYSIALNSKKRESALYNIFLLSQKTNNMSKQKFAFDLLKKEFPNSLFTVRSGADMYLADGDTLKSLSLLNSIKKKDANDWYCIASIYSAMGDSVNVNKALKKLPNDSLWQSKIIEIKAKLTFNTKNYNASYNYWKSVNDTSFATVYNTVLSAFKAKEFENAYNLSKTLLNKTTDADRADVYRLLGNIAFSLKKWEEAKNWYIQLSGFEAKNPIVQYNLAVAYYNLKDAKNACKYYSIAKNKDKNLANKEIEKLCNWNENRKNGGTTFVLDSIDRMYNNAVDLQKEHKDTLAENIYLKIVKTNPKYSLAWNNLGTIYSARGNLQEAIHCYMRAIEHKHSLDEAYANLVGIYIEQKKFDIAKRCLFKGQLHNPDSKILKDLSMTLENALKSNKND